MFSDIPVEQHGDCELLMLDTWPRWARRSILLDYDRLYKKWKHKWFVI